MSESNDNSDSKPETVAPKQADQDLSQRLNDLSARAKSIRIEAGLEPKPEHSRRNGAAGKMGLGGRVVTELVVGTCVGGLIGYGFDIWVGTEPWGLAGGLVLGFAGSIMTIYRVVRGYDEAVGLGRATRGTKDHAAPEKDQKD